MQQAPSHTLTIVLSCDDIVIANQHARGLRAIPGSSSIGGLRSCMCKWTTTRALPHHSLVCLSADELTIVSALRVVEV